MSPPARQMTIRSSNHERVMAHSRYAVRARTPLPVAATRIKRKVRRRAGLVIVAAIAATVALAGPASASPTVLGRLPAHSSVASTDNANTLHVLGR